MAAWTKLDIIRQAYAECGRADYEFDLNPEDLETGLRLLDAMMATWAALGIRIGYSGGDGTGEIDASTEVPLWACEALYLKLAERLAPSFGKTLSPQTLANAKAAFDAVRVRTTKPMPRVLRGYGGAGNGARAMPVQVDPIATGPDSALDFGA